MKRILYILLLFPVWGATQSYTLAITQGYGNGVYSKGDSIHVWADPAETNHVFTHWSGNGAAYLINNDEWHSQLIIPENETDENIFLTANYEELVVADFGQFNWMLWGELEEDGTFFPTEKLIDYAYPLNPKALVFLIHGTGGNSSSWVDRYDRRSIIKDLVHNGYAVFALNSNETTLGDQNEDGKIRWQTDPFRQDTSTNIDFKNVIDTRDKIFDELDFSELPVFMLGGSNGANFSDYATAALDFKASCHMTGNGITAIFENHPNLKPIIWIQSINDNNSSADSSKARANYDVLIDQGITTEWHWLNRSPVHPFRFERSRNVIDSELSMELFTQLQNQQLLDENNYLNVLHLNADFPFESFYNSVELTNLQQRDFEDQLNVVNADHGANGDFNKTIIRFFNNCLLINSTEGIQEVELNTISIYPNPSMDFVNISSSKKESIKYKIFTSDGTLVLEKDQLSETHSIDISDLTTGLYFVKTENKIGEKGLSKFIKI